MAEISTQGERLVKTQRMDNGIPMRLPRKLKKDAIVEALWEVRFESADSASYPELVVGTLAGHSKWKKFAKTRLPLSDIPAPIRQNDPSLRNQATLELRSAEQSRVVKIGGNVFSYHVLQPYCGGEQFKTEVGDAIDFVFGSLDMFKPIRFGLRYINLMNELDHHVKSVTDLKIEIMVANESLGSPLNLNFRRKRGEDHLSMIRISSPEFVSGPANVAMNALVDVDISTPDVFEVEEISRAKEWVEQAKRYELEDFWRLIPERIHDHIVEEWEP